MKLPHALKNLPPRRERYFSFSVQPFQIESQENLSYIRIIFGIRRKKWLWKSKNLTKNYYFSEYDYVYAF